MIREIRDFIRYFFKIPSIEKSIVFYSEHEGYYPVFEGMINELVNKHKQTLCYITSDSNDPILFLSKPKLHTFYINKLLALFFALVNCKVFVMTLTDFNQFHLKRSVNPVHYVYVFHSMISTHMKYLAGAFDHYDTILCAGPHHIKEIRCSEKLNKLNPKTLVEAGYFPLERIHFQYQKYLVNKPRSEYKNTVLIAPSWGHDNVLESCGDRLIELLLEDGHEVIVRPHPETVKRSPQLLNTFDLKFGNNPAFILEKSVADCESLLKSDILICDLSGVALEYAFGTNRPVIFLDVPFMVRNQEYENIYPEVFEISIREKIGVIASSDNLYEIPKIIDRIKNDRISFSAQIDKLRKSNIYSFGNSSLISSKYILDVIENKKNVVRERKL